jgi:hypothetical protein
VGQQLGVVGLAARAQELALVLQAELLGRRVRRAVVREERVELAVGEAVQRPALSDTARVEADDVVALADRLGDDRDRSPGVVEPGGTGARRG